MSEFKTKIFQMKNLYFSRKNNLYGGGGVGKGNYSSARQFSGRSMIEMLAVLAIIAIISAGGIWGISTVIDKNKADKIAREVANQSEEIRNRRYVKDTKNVVYNGKSDYVKNRYYELKDGKIKYLFLETPLSLPRNPQTRVKR